jgi:hypothetical protein
MGRSRLENIVHIAVLLVAALTPAPAGAGGHKHRDGANAAGYVDPAAIPAAYYPPGSMAYPPGNSWCYAIPIQAVYQFPAVIANQPGAEVGWLRVHPEYGLLGGQPHLYRP